MASVGSLWSPVEVSAVVPAARLEVFTVISDPTTYPQWLVGAQRMRSVDSRFPEPGSSFHHSVGPSEGLTIDDSSEVLDVDAPNRLVLEVRVGFIRGLVELRVLDHPRGSEVRFRERPIGVTSIATPLVRPLIHARNAKSLEQLAQRFRS